jgi:hypothetical protein
MDVTKFSRFCTFDGHGITLKEGDATPDSVSIKKFMKWWAASSVGRVQQAVNLTSAMTTWQRLQATIYRFTGKKVKRRVNEDILAVSVQDYSHQLVLTQQWIKTDLIKEGLVAREKNEKQYCDSVVFCHLMQQLWCLDADEFDWERDRVQIAFMLQMHFFSAARPGALVSTGYYPNLHLKYSNVLFALVRRKDGTAKFTIVLTQ